ncbi:MAG: AIR synthase related protein, partial [Planctomycetota bacterium]
MTLDENKLIRALRERARAPDGMTGIGDDCCIWTPRGETCLSVDAIAENHHFRRGDDPRAVGRKAAAAAISDLAAMGARPVGAVVAISCSAHWDAAAVMDGLASELERLHCPLLGGDTTAADSLVVSVTVWGEAVSGTQGTPGRLVRRSGGRTGDLLVVTGSFGGSLASGRHLRPEP